MRFGFGLAALHFSSLELLLHRFSGRLRLAPCCLGRFQRLAARSFNRLHRGAHAGELFL